MRLPPMRAVICTIALTLPLAALARAPYTPRDANTAVLRFSWRLSERGRENCRPRTQAEMDALPAHMRTPEVCTRDRASYVLLTRIDSAARDSLVLARGGIKGDRPLFVLEERRLPTGRHRVEVELRRVSTATGTHRVAVLDTVLDLQRGEVQLVTLDGGQRLITRSSPEAVGR